MLITLIGVNGDEKTPLLMAEAGDFRVARHSEDGHQILLRKNVQVAYRANFSFVPWTFTFDLHFDPHGHISEYDDLYFEAA